MFKHWIQNSTTTGMWLRTARRNIHKLRHKGNPKFKVAMLHVGRCGSSVIADQLCQHPQITWANELFEAMQPAYYNMSDNKRGQQRIADTLYAANTAYFGYETKYLPEQHLRKSLINSSLEGYFDHLAELGFTHYILLRRDNYLRMAVSLEIGRRTRQWHTMTKQPQKTLELDVNEVISYGERFTLIEFFEHLAHHFEKINQLLADLPTLSLSYEGDIAEAPQEAFNKCCEFIGLEPFEANVRLKKQNPGSLKTILTNYDEVAECLSGSKYEWMLNS